MTALDEAALITDDARAAAGVRLGSRHREADNEHVDAKLRATMRNQSRM